MPEVIAAANAEGEAVEVDLEHHRGRQMQPAGEAVFHQRDGIVAREVFVAVVIHLMRFLVHAFGLAGPAEVQTHVVAELGMELTVHAELYDIGEVIGTFVGHVVHHGAVGCLVATHRFVGLQEPHRLGGEDRSTLFKLRARFLLGDEFGTTQRMIAQSHHPAEHVDAAVGQPECSIGGV